MAQKGVLTTAEYLPLEEFMRLVEGLHKDKLYLWEIFCRLSYWGALRVSDVLKQTWGDILDKNVFVVYEGKTGKSRQIPFGNTVKEYFSMMYKMLDQPDKSSLIFLSPRTKRAYTSQYINELLKVFRVDYRLSITNFSTHTFRKTFGRCVYESHGKSAESLILLNSILRHSSIDTTKVYIGIRQDEINSVYSLTQT